ncbi:hypothetical protein Rhopal_006210-T1 [Rhodotorula paludigena]|uniref:Uncharacterized protein n=1 Tax=Rhodotorula paludigena TaxID=86838 RepID=A0AAV5GSF2_9BASI|nr:hypothetical protein Rhopal_006210-T1 [Rhodotorula paludigena]
MATLERPRPEGQAHERAFEPAAVPTPFPERDIADQAEPARGRTAVPGLAHRQVGAAEEEHSASRSPGGTRRSLSRVVDRVKRAMSASRDRQADFQDRGRRLSADTAATGHDDQQRGRSPLAAFQPRSVSRGPSFSTVAENNDSQATMYPVTKSQTRSSSRGRSLNPTPPAGGKVFSTGRGGAGNLIGVAPSEDMTEFDGEEDPNVVRAVREDRSRSREREGRIDVASSGRGGRGNIRSASRGRDLELGRVPTVLEEQERTAAEDEELRLQELMRKREREAPEQHYVSTGRGGAGNIFSSFRKNGGAEA